MRSEYSAICRALALDSYRLFNAIIKGDVKIRSEFPEVGQLLAWYLCWRFDAEIIGVENIPVSGGTFLIGDHQQAFDGPLVIHGARSRGVNLVVKNDSESRKALTLLRLLTGAITINRNSSDFETMRTIVSILKRGGAVCMFPEGHRSKDGKVRGFHPGAAVIARRAPKAKIVPFAITNASHLTVGSVVKNLDRGIHRRKKPAIEFGPSFQLPPARLPPKQQREEDTRIMRGSVLDLLPEDMAGEDVLYVVDHATARKH